LIRLRRRFFISRNLEIINACTTQYIELSETTEGKDSKKFSLQRVLILVYNFDLNT